MKILQVFDYISLPHGGGTVHVIYRLSQALARRNHEVTIYASNIELDREYIDSMPEVKVRAFHRWLNLAGMQIMPGMISAVKKELGNFDIIHLHCFRSFQNIVIHRYSKKYAIPYVIDAHGSLPRSHGRISLKRPLKWLYDVFFGYGLLKDATAFIAETEAGFGEYEELGVDSDKIFLVPPPFPVEDFSELPPPGMFRNKHNLQERKIILYMGRINWIKGLDFLVKSFGELLKSRNDVMFVIAGDDDGYKSELIRLINELELKDKVVFTGFISDEEKLAALTDADVLVQVSIYEQGTGVPYEAVMCNTPVIVSKDTIASENISNIDGGYLVKYGDIYELSNVIGYVIDNPEEAKSKTIRTQEYVKANLSLNKAVEKYEQLYSHCIDGDSNNKHNKGN